MIAVEQFDVQFVARIDQWRFATAAGRQRAITAWADGWRWEYGESGALDASGSPLGACFGFVRPHSPPNQPILTHP